jgi:hypothetical protein
MKPEPDNQWKLDNIRASLSRLRRVSKQQLRKEAIAQTLADKKPRPDFPEPEPEPVKRLT